MQGEARCNHIVLLGKGDKQFTRLLKLLTYKMQ